MLNRFGTLPDHQTDLLERFLEADWLDRRHAQMLAAELSQVLSKIMGG